MINKLTFLVLMGTSSLSAAGAFTDWGSTILHHVADSKTISFYGISISKHIIMLLISAAVTLIISLLATAKYRKNLHAKPFGLSQIFEVLMEFINKEIVIPNIGKNYSHTWTPLAMTFFVFILTCNLLGLIPFFEYIKIGGGGGSTATGNFGVTLGLATITFFAIIIAGVKKHGFIGHWKNMVPSGVPAPVLIILIPIEIIGMFVKPFALIMRLGANMTAGHVVLMSILGLIFIFKNWIGGTLSFGLAFSLSLLELLVCVLQAYIFTMLSALYFGAAVEDHHH